MRKLFFLLVLASGMLVAQPSVTNTQTIGKYLKLSKVPIGLETDNVLVRGSDNIVRYVPKSQFGGGGSQDLTSVLDIGNMTNRSITLSSGDNQAKLLSAGPAGFASVSPGYLTAGYNDGSRVLTIGYDYFIRSGTRYTLPHVNNTINTRTLAISVNGEYADANGNINVSSGGTPTLQQVIDVDGFAYRDNNQASILEPDGSGGYSTQFASQSADFSNNQQIYVDKVTAGIQSLSSSSRGYVELSGGRVFIRQTDIFNNLKTEIKINDPLSISNISFPAPPVPGDYTLAIIGTTAPSSSTDTGTFGETRVTSTYVYHCIDTNTWVRQAVEASF